MSSIIRITLSILASFALLPALAQAGHHEGGDHSVAAEVSGDDVVWASGGRALVAEVEGEVIAVDLETREVVVRGPAGNLVTLSAREDGVDLSKIAPGDTIIADTWRRSKPKCGHPLQKKKQIPGSCLEKWAERLTTTV